MTTLRHCLTGGPDEVFRPIVCPIIREVCVSAYKKPCVFLAGSHVTRIPGQPEVRTVDCAFPDPDPTPETDHE